MKRRELREHIFKLLFMSEFNEAQEMPEQLKLYFEGMEELAEEDQENMRQRYALVTDHVEEIDEILNRTSRGWKTRRMSKVDLALLRLAAAEILYDTETPVGVAINEAVELAKNFGGETSASFINGILGRIAREAETKKEAEKVPDEAVSVGQGEEA